MKSDEKKIDTSSVATRTTYETDCFRKVKDEETGKTEVKRWVEQRVAGANLQVVDAGKGGVFHNGARIA
jgi:hypothetical protein